MPDPNLKFSTGDHVLVVRNRYQTLGIINDFLTGLWFLTGSILFLSASTKDLGIAFFIAGSAELLIRPAIRLVRNVHLKRIAPGTNRDQSENT